MTSVQQLSRRLEVLAEHGRPGPATLSRLLPRGPIPDSGSETRLFQRIRKTALPMPKPQFRIMDGERLLAQVDFAYPEARLAIEFDSDEFHSEPFDRDRDAARYNRLGVMGWLVLLATPGDLADPRSLVEAIRLRLASHSDAKRG
jgi:very-short-patch-repair endonuclease